MKFSRAELESYRGQTLPELLQRGIGITNLVAGASARADELTQAELAEGAAPPAA
ncbi:hypothetical protein V3W46_15620 [Subtercola sp. YIM 133946]